MAEQSDIRDELSSSSTSAAPKNDAEPAAAAGAAQSANEGSAPLNQGVHGQETTSPQASESNLQGPGRKVAGAIQNNAELQPQVKPAPAPAIAAAPKRRGLFSFIGKGVEGLLAGGKNGNSRKAGAERSSAQQQATTPAHAAGPGLPAGTVSAAPPADVAALHNRVAQLEQALTAAHRRRLEDFYDIFNAEKKGDVPGLLAKYGHGRADIESLFDALKKRYHVADAIQQLRAKGDTRQEDDQSETVFSLRAEVERLQQQLASKSDACATLNLQVQSDRALREALQEATHDMALTMERTTTEAKQEVEQAKAEAQALVEKSKQDADARVAEIEESTRAAREASEEAQRLARAKVDEADTVIRSHKDVEDSLRAEMEATKQHCQKRVYELEEKSSEEFKAHAAALERLSAAHCAAIEELQREHQDNIQAMEAKNVADHAATVKDMSDKQAALSAQMSKYKEQKSVLVEAAKQFQANLDAANKTIDDLRAELADHKDKANSQLTATLAMAEARASELSTELANVHHRLEERCQLILCNLYSFVMAAGSKHAGYLFKRGSAYDGQMHSAKSKNVGGLQGLKLAIFGSSQERRRYFKIDAKYIQYFASDKDAEADPPVVLGSVPISDIQSLGILDSVDTGGKTASASSLQNSMDTTNYCFEVVLSDRIYSLRAGDRLMRALWLYRLRLLLAIRVQIAAHTQMLTQAASLSLKHPDNSGGSASFATAQEDGEASPRTAKQLREAKAAAKLRKRKLDTLSTNLLQTYAVTFGFTVNKGDAMAQEESAGADSSREHAGGGNATAGPKKTLSSSQLVLKMFNEVPSRGMVMLDGGGTRIEVIPTFSSSQCLWWKYSSDEIEGMSDEQNRIGFQVMFHPLKGCEEMSSDNLFSPQSAEFGHIRDFKHVYADVTMMIRYDILEQEQLKQQDNARKRQERGRRAPSDHLRQFDEPESPADFGSSSTPLPRKEWPGRHVCMPMAMVPAFRTQQMGMLESPGVGHISLIWNNVHSPHTDKKLHYWLQVTKDINSPPTWLDPS